MLLLTKTKEWRLQFLDPSVWRCERSAMNAGTFPTRVGIRLLLHAVQGCCCMLCVSIKTQREHVLCWLISMTCKFFGCGRLLFTLQRSSNLANFRVTRGDWGASVCQAAPCHWNSVCLIDMLPVASLFT